MNEPETGRDPLEVLAAEYTERLRRGDAVSVEEFAVRHPGLAAEIRELFPILEMTERSKARQVRSAGGRATLGASRPERLGDFRLVREIGRGGMGVVFEAEQESLGRRVAVKVLPRQMLLDERQVRRFEQEARIAAGLHHTNIVEVYGVGEDGGFHYYVMQYLHGVSLDAVIGWMERHARGMHGSSDPGAKESVVDEDTRVEVTARRLAGAGAEGEVRQEAEYWRSVARVGLQAAEALDYAHAQGVLHRDVKPSNLVVGAEGMVWLTDFGLARAAVGTDGSRTGELGGTLRYMAPEQFAGGAEARSDVYGLGLALFEMMTLRPAFEETDTSRLIGRITQGGEARLPETLRGRVPPDLATILLKAIQPEATARYASAGEMAQEFRRFLEDRPIRARRTGPVERWRRWCRRNPAMAGLTLVSVILVAAVMGVTSVAYVRTERALRGEAKERAQAATNAALAARAFDRVFARFPADRPRVSAPTRVAGAGEAVVGAVAMPGISREMAAMLEDVLPFYDELARQPGADREVAVGRAEASRRVGAIRQRLGQWDAALGAYRRAGGQYEELRLRYPEDAGLRLEAVRVWNELGRVHATRHDAVAAREAHLAALALLEPMDWAEGAMRMAARHELARTEYFLGVQERPFPAAGRDRAAGRKPVTERGADRLARAVEVLEPLVDGGTGRPEDVHLLALCYLEGAEPREGGEWGGRGSREERAMAMLEQLVEAHPDEPHYAFDLSEAYVRFRLPQPPIAEAEGTRIRTRCGKAGTLLERLIGQHPEAPEFRAARARLWDKLGSLARLSDQWEEARKDFGLAVEEQTLLVARFPDAPVHALWLAAFRIALGDALLHLNQASAARVELEESTGVLERLATGPSALAVPPELRALGLAKLGAALRRTGDRERGDTATREAERLRATAKETNRTGRP